MQNEQKCYFVSNKKIRLYGKYASEMQLKFTPLITGIQVPT